MKTLTLILLAGGAFAQQTPRPHSTSTNVIVRNGGSYLGVGVAEMTGERAKALKLSEERGVEVKVVDEGSPAAKAGLKPEDVLLEFNGQRIEGYLQFSRMVSETPPGRKATLSVFRTGAPVTVTATLEPRSGFNFTLPPMPPMPPRVIMPDLPRANVFWRTGMLGIESEALTSQLAEFFGVTQGVLVRMVNRQSPAEKAGMKAGDVIVKAAGKSVATTRDVSSQLQDRSAIPLTVVRNRKEVTLEVNLDAARP